MPVNVFDILRGAAKRDQAFQAGGAKREALDFEPAGDYTGADAPARPRSYGAAAMRPSLSALSRSREDDPNAFEVAPTFEQRRQAQTLADMDARTNRGLEEDRQRNATSFDLGSGSAAKRAQQIGDIASDETRRGHHLQNELYFAPDEKARREDEFATEMERLRQRYTDPALVRGQADLERERVRAAGGVDRANISGVSGIARQEVANQGAQGVANTRADATLGVEAGKQGGDVTPFRPKAQAVDPGKTFTMQDLQEYARDNGMSVMDALTVFRTSGYSMAR